MALVAMLFANVPEKCMSTLADPTLTFGGFP